MEKRIDFVYDPEDWLETVNWDVRDEVHGWGDHLETGKPKRIATLIEGPSKWCVKVQVDPDDPEDTDVLWFDSEEEAKAAANI